MNTVSLFTFRDPLPNKTEQQNQRKAKQTIHVEKYRESFPPGGKKSCLNIYIFLVLFYSFLSPVVLSLHVKVHDIHINR